MKIVADWFPVHHLIRKSTDRFTVLNLCFILTPVQLYRLNTHCAEANVSLASVLQEQQTCTPCCTSCAREVSRALPTDRYPA